MAKKYYVDETTFFDEVLVNDQNDLLYKHVLEPKEKYAIIRNHTCKSIKIIQLT